LNYFFFRLDTKETKNHVQTIACPLLFKSLFFSQSRKNNDLLFKATIFFKSLFYKLKPFVEKYSFCKFIANAAPRLDKAYAGLFFIGNANINMHYVQIGIYPSKHLCPCMQIISTTPIPIAIGTDHPPDSYRDG